MIGSILSVTAILALLALSGTAVWSRKEGACWPLACAALLLAALEAAGLLAPKGGPGSEVWWRADLVLESMLSPVLLWYGFSFARRDPLRAASLRGATVLAAAFLFPSAALFLPVEDFVYAPDFLTEHMLFLGDTGYWFTIGLMLSCVVALVNIEATFTLSRGKDRWKIKFEVIGAAAILGFLIFYFSQGLLYRSIDAGLLPVRSSVLIAGAGAILASRALRGNGVGIAVSRTVFYRSVAVLAVGLYLVMLGLFGEGMRYLDVPFSRAVTVFLAFAGAVALLTALVSERLRRRARVFISKHFFAQKHDYRQVWLDLTEKLSSCSSAGELQKAIINVYQDIFGLARASLYRSDVAGRYLPHPKESEGSHFHPSPELLSYFGARNRVWNPSDGEHAPSEEELRFIRTENVRLAVPLVVNGHLEGLLVFRAFPERERFTYEDYDLMKAIARQSALLLSNLRLSEELIQTRELAAVARLSSFVIHDLKNLANALALTVENAEEHIGRRDFQEDLMSTIRQTVGKMKKLTQRLKAYPKSGRTGAGQQDLLRLAAAVVEEFRRNRPDASVVCRGEAVSCTVDPEELRTVVVNLIQNGIEAGGGRAAVTVETGMSGGSAVLKVADDGCGIPPEFLNRDLFKPFRSTKKNGLGIGLYQCRQIVESVGGRISVTSVHGKGTTFTVTLPAHADDRSLRPVP